ncbi:MAG: methyltransferase [Myxococcales bacterium]|nr:methyltransferase [Polyangiaceae bacterium]MDW8249614.1 methyltransferase [Myxococcales bacterium]
MTASNVTEDALLGGRLSYRQPARGYRVGLEAPLLAAFALPRGRRPPRVVVDLGAGPGAVALCLAFQLPRARVVLVERDPLHAALARDNLERNGLGDRSQVHERDAQGSEEVLGRGVADLVVSNPPWFDRAGGQLEAQGEVREASRGLDARGFMPFCQSARQLLGRGGRFCMAAPAPALATVLAALEDAGLVAKRLRWLHARREALAQVFFVEALAGKPGGLVVEAPWFVRGTGEEFTPEVRALLWGEAFPRRGGCSRGAPGSW